MRSPRQVQGCARATGRLAKTDRVELRCWPISPRWCGPDPGLCPSSRASEPDHQAPPAAGDAGGRAQQAGVLAPVHPPAAPWPISTSWMGSSGSWTTLSWEAPLPGEGGGPQERVWGAPTTACALLAYLPELGQVGRNAIACLAGVMPLAWESGRRWGRRRIRGGPARAREALYMATLVALRHNPWLRELYQCLLAAGKPRKVAMVPARASCWWCFTACPGKGPPGSSLPSSMLDIKEGCSLFRSPGDGLGWGGEQHRVCPIGLQWLAVAGQARDRNQNVWPRLHWEAAPSSWLEPAEIPGDGGS